MNAFIHSFIHHTVYISSNEGGIPNRVLRLHPLRSNAFGPTMSASTPAGTANNLESSKHGTYGNAPWRHALRSEWPFITVHAIPRYVIPYVLYAHPPMTVMMAVLADTLRHDRHKGGLGAGAMTGRELFKGAPSRKAFSKKQPAAARAVIVTCYRTARWFPPPPHPPSSLTCGFGIWRS